MATRLFSFLMSSSLCFVGIATQIGCGSLFRDNSEADAPHIANYAGLAIAGVDTKYSSSAFLYYDFELGKVTPIQSGESGEPGLFWLGDRLYWFNRTAGNINFSTSDIRSENKSLSKQVKTDGASAGDPYDVLLLPDGTLLMAHYNASSLTVNDAATGGIKQTIEADWDLPSKTKLKPVALWSRTIAGVLHVFLLHQGFSVDGYTYTPDGSQQIFALRWNGTSLEAVDQNTGKERIQGIPLAATAADRFLLGDSGRPILVGLCSSYVGASCTSAIQRFDPESMAVETLWDFSGFPYFMNGVAVAADEDTFYLPVQRKADNGAGVRELVRFELADKTTTTVHTYSDVYQYGTWVVNYVPSTNVLLVAEPRTLTAGNLWVYKENAQPEKIELDTIPYQSALVPKP